MSPGQAQPNPPREASVYERSQAAFYRDLPGLLHEHCGEWVAYHGEERVGFAPTRVQLYEECFRRGFQEDEFYIGRLWKRPEPPWEPIEIEPRYGEIDDDDMESIPKESP